ncbi:hypothetical protein M8623_003318 [Salmonella enterica subsp. enterica]|nr:hypothetical protein [Salmonella enterica subsp. enterica]
MSSFEQLMATLNAIDAEASAPVEEMAKALPSDEDDKKIAAAEAEGDKEEEDDEKSSDKEGSEYDKEGAYEKKEEKPLEKCDLKKSFENEEGEELIDATEVIEGLQKSFATHDDILAKAMPKIVDLLGVQSKQLKEQGDLIKSMQEQLATFGARGTGRKSAVTVMAKSHVANQPAVATPAEPEEMTTADIMVKANSLFDQKLLSGLQLTKLDVALRNGYAPEADILAVLAKH